MIFDQQPNLPAVENDTIQTSPKRKRGGKNLPASLALRASVINGLCLVFLLPSLLMAEAKPPAPRFRIEAPSRALRDVPLSGKQFVRITAMLPNGETDKTFKGPATIDGVLLTQHGQSVSFPAWKAGVIELRPSVREDQQVYLTGSQIKVHTKTEETPITHDTQLVWKWWSLIPPFVAIVLAIWLKEVISALLLGVFAGALVLANGNPFAAFLRTIDTHILHQLVPPDGSADHMKAVLFTLMLGGMIGVMSSSGGTRALVDRLTRYAKSREHGQVMTWLLGLVVFFDDYANTLLVGSTMRSVSDRLRISREKLAFLVDSTAAPVAGLAIVSTWVGVEVGYIQSALEQLGGQPDVAASSLFLSSIPYRFYPILLLFFVGAVAWTGRDFGPMRKREAELALNPHLPDEDEKTSQTNPGSQSPPKIAIYNATIPLCALLAGITTGYALDVDAYDFLMCSAFGAVLVAGLTAVSLRLLSLTETVEAGLSGMKSMLIAVVILVLAWTVAGLCDSEHLNSAGFIIDGLGENLSSRWMPAIAFVIAAGVSFATGSSFATMGLLMPLCITLTYSLMTGEAFVDGLLTHPYLLGTIGAVLAGSIWGDHCSPISDTTVLSSAAAGCDHLSHVATQMPYAMTVGLVALFGGYLPIAFGVSPWITLPLSLAVLFGILHLIGRHPPGIREEDGFALLDETR